MRPDQHARSAVSARAWSLGSGVDLSLHFAIGFAGASLPSASPLTVAVVLAAVGLVVTLYIARRRRARTAAAVTAWTQATCPVCLALEAVAPARLDPAVRWESAA